VGTPTRDSAGNLVRCLFRRLSRSDAGFGLVVAEDGSGGDGFGALLLLLRFVAMSVVDEKEKRKREREKKNLKIWGRERRR
jgi:hypothetical protein